MKYWLFGLIVFIHWKLLAQDSTKIYRTETLPGVCVNYLRVNLHKDAEIKFNRYEIKSINANFSNGLHQASLVNVRNYGPSQISTLSIRGLGSQHVATIWNDLNMTNSMHGTADASLLIPYSILQNNTITYGANQLQGSNNNIAGSINQNSFIDADHGLDFVFALHLGSFQKHQQYIGIKNIQTKYSIGFDMFHESAKNDFYYKSMTLSTTWNQKNKHSSHEIYQANGIFLYQIKRYLQFKTAVSYTQAYRQIAPSIFEATQDGIQKDAQLKSFMAFIYYKHKWQLNISNGYAYEYLYFEKKSASIFSDSKLHKNITQIRFYLPVNNKHHVVAKIENTFSLAKNEAYNRNAPTQNVLSALLSYRFETYKLHAAITLHQQLINKQLAPFLFDVDAMYKIKKAFICSIKGSRIYRYPTLNDLYWTDGGNQKLLAEKGWNIEYSVYMKAEKNHFFFDVKATNFYYWIQNWIQWTPTSYGNWSPKNTKKVFSRGIEIQSQLKYNYNKMVIELRPGYSYTLPTQISDGELYGKQLIYETKHKMYLNFMLNIYQVGLDYSFQYTGSRYTSSDNAYSLLPFHTSDLKISYDYNYKQMHIVPYFSVQNLTNTSYQMMQGRPMMGRNFMFGIRFSLHKNLIY